MDDCLCPCFGGGVRWVNPMRFRSIRMENYLSTVALTREGIERYDRSDF